MELITTHDALADFCVSVKSSDFIAVDTEFIREKTFWPRLCLIQIAGQKDSALIDALAPEMDLSPLRDLMTDPQLLKVFHAARQDIEIFLHLFGAVPAPLFDTQVAAMVCNFGDSVAFDSLVFKLVGRKIDKSQRLSDWSYRPLNAQQVSYALADVTYLRNVYLELGQRLKNNGREGWLKEEMALLNNPATYHNEPKEAWKRIKCRSQNSRLLAVLQELAAWRETRAQHCNIPRRHVLRDDTLLELASMRPQTTQELLRSRSFPAKQAEKPMGQAILKAIETALHSPSSSWPKPEKKPELPHQAKPVIALLKLFLKMTCDTHGVAMRLIASSEDIEAIALKDEADVPALHGWRRDLFGAAALEMKQGKKAIALHQGTLKLIDLET